MNKGIKKFLIGAAACVLALTLTACGQSSAFDAKKDITVISREKGSGTRGAFIELFGIEQKDANGNKVDRTSSEAQQTNSTSVVLTTVAGNKYAIGYISLGSLNSTVKALKIDGAEATAENVKNGSYKVSRPFNVVYKGELDELAKDFLGYIMSAEGQAVIEKAGYIASDASAAPYAGSKPAGRITVGGSSSVTPVMNKLKEAYAAVNPSAEIIIQESDSTTGINGAVDGVCQLGMASRALKDSEKEKGLTDVKIALDGVAVIVNNENPTDALTSAQIGSIFMGETKTWELK